MLLLNITIAIMIFILTFTVFVYIMLNLINMILGKIDDIQQKAAMRYFKWK